MPPYIERLVIELTNRCNMKCLFCPHHVLKTRRKDMDFELFKKIIKDISDYNSANSENRLTDIIIFTGMGEQLLYSKFNDAVKYVVSNGLKAHLTTNGLILNDEKYSGMVTSGIDYVNISFHNLTKDSFKYRGTKVSYQKYYNNLLSLIDLHLHKQFSNHLEISVMYSLPDSKEAFLWDQLPSMHFSSYQYILLLLDFLRDIFNLLDKRNIIPETGIGDLLGVYENGTIKNSTVFNLTKNLSLHFTPLQHQVFNTREKLKGEAGKKIELVKKHNAHCYYLRGCPMIFSNGDFIPCGSESTGELTMGTVSFETSFISILNSEKYRQFVKLITAPIDDLNKLPFPCRECMVLNELKWKSSPLC